MVSMREINYNVEGRKINQRSNLAKIQLDLLKICVEKCPERLQEFGNFLVTNPAMMDNENMYPGLENVGIVYQQTLAKTYQSQMNMGHVK